MYDRAARCYDLIHDARGRDVTAEADLVVAEIVARNPSATTLLDVACGTGAHLPRFSERFEVTGVDLSADMLAIAAEGAPSVPLVQADMRTLDLDRRFDAVTCLFSSSGYQASDDDFRAATSSMAAHLVPGGVLVVEGWIEPEHWIEGSLYAEAARDADMAVGRVTRGERDGRVTTLFMRYTIATQEEIETIDEVHVMRLTDPAEVDAAFAAAGLSCERLTDLLHPGRSVFVGVAGR